MLKLTTSLRIPPRKQQHRKPSKSKSIQNMLTTTLLLQRQRKSYMMESVRTIKTKATLSSLILLANLFYYEDEVTGKKRHNVNHLSSSVDDGVGWSSNLDMSGGISTRRITHTCRLSESSTFEFERREHKEQLLENFEVAEEGVKATIVDEFQEKDIEFQKEELDELNTKSSDKSSLFEESEDIGSSSSTNSDYIIESFDIKSDVTKDEEVELPTKDEVVTFEEKLQIKKQETIEKYSKSEDLGERAFATLLQLNMVELTPDPDDPDYDHSKDDLFVVS